MRRSGLHRCNCFASLTVALVQSRRRSIDDTRRLAPRSCVRGDGAAMTTAKTIAVRIGAALCSIWLAGCGISAPQTAAEFRNGVANGIAAGATKDTFEVDRSLAQVGASFQRLASECLSTTIRMTEHQ